MALANALEHPVIKPETMGKPFEGRMIKRSNKDLGRVLAISYLSLLRDSDALLDWPKLWLDAVRNRFPENWIEKIQKVGSGLRQLLKSTPDLDEALHTCVYGLLVSSRPTHEQLIISGERFIADVIEPLEKSNTNT